MKSKFLIAIAALICPAFLSAFKVTVVNTAYAPNNITGKVDGQNITITTQAYSALNKTVEGKPRTEEIAPGKSKTFDFLLSNTAYVKWTEGNREYKMDLSAFKQNITFVISTGGAYSLNPKVHGVAKKIN